MQGRICCFTGHSIHKLKTDEKTVKEQLEKQIRISIENGVRTFITGMATGVDIYAGEVVAEIKKSDPSIRLIAAIPWKGQTMKWSDEWKERHAALLTQCDDVVIVNEGYKGYHRCFYHVRDRWMVDHSDMVIAYYNGTAGGTQYTMEYAREKGKELIVIDEMKLAEKD